MGLSQRRERLVARLRVPRSRAREGLVLVEGVRAAGEAMEAGAVISFAVVSPRVRETEGGPELLGRLAGVDVVELDDRELGRLSETETSQGVALVCEEPRAGVEAMCGEGRHLVLDAVQDPGNAGTLIRAALAFGLDAVVCLDGTADPWASKAVRASAGMGFRIPIVRASAADTLARLREVEVPLYAADPGGADVDELDGLGSFALAVGNEGRGVRDEVARAARSRVAVRMPGPAESLNVAMAGSILLHALTRGHEHE